MRDAQGQNIVEYILFVAAIILVCVVFFKPQAGSPMYDSLNAALNSMVTQMNNGTSAIQFNSNPSSNPS